MTTRSPNRRRPRGRLALLLTGVLALGSALVVPGQASADPAEPSTPAPAAGSVHGLRGEYFVSDGEDRLASLAATRLDGAVHFPDLVATYTNLTGQGTGTGARWTGFVEPPTTEDYTFSAIGDNGFRVWVDDALVIDHWVGDWDVEQTSAPVALVAGTRHALRVEHFQDDGGASMHLRWESASQPRQVVPVTALTPPDGFPGYAPAAVVAADGLSTTLTVEDDLADVDESLLPHLQVVVDDQPYPLEAASLADARTLTIALGLRVDRASVVRVVYDGDGGATTAGSPVPAFDVPTVNESSYAMQTSFSESIDRDAPLPEYPRPQLVRPDWQNLNGPWEFAAASEGEAPPVGQTLAETVIVPYPVESYLSGIERHEDHMVYRREVTVPPEWEIGSGKRLRLNFGAVDHEASVWLDGTAVGEHTGGYLPFSLDLTDHLVGTGTHELVVAVTDTTDPQQPVGKQRANPGGIFYTPSSGIWQTVWMEPVPEVSVDSVVATPDIHAGTAEVTVASTTATATDLVTVVATDRDGDEVGRVTGPANTGLVLPVPDPHLWSPDDPYLYDLDVSITGGDTVRSYVGMRSIDLQTVNGVQRIVLNDEPTFLLSTLDQGYWPESQYTQPTDAALRFDLQLTKDLGFTTIRKHIKVESARFYHHADVMGLMVWQDMIPAGEQLTSQEAKDTLEAGMYATVDALRGFPSIVQWTVFNEGWSEWSNEAAGRIAEAIKVQDPSRLVSARSGLNCCEMPGDSGQGDIIDWHAYPGPGFPTPDATRAAVDGEHGGFSFSVLGHTWPGAFTPYEAVADKEALTAAYVESTRTLVEPARTFLSGSVYTQVSDVEGEVNGFVTYDRRVAKMDLEQVRAVNLEVIAAGASAGDPRPTTPGLTGDGAWTFDEGAGSTSADVSGQGHDVTLAGGADWTDGHSGSALRLDGAGQHAATTTPVLDTAAGYSVSAWVRLDALPEQWATAVSQDGTTGQSAFFLQYGQGGFAFSLPGEVRAVGPLDVALDRWYHLTGVWDPTAQQARLYVDGELVGEVDAPGTASLGRTVIGAGQFDRRPVDFWRGALDDVRVFQRVLDADDVRALVTGVVPEPPGPTPEPEPTDGGPGGTGDGAGTRPGVPGAGADGAGDGADAGAAPVADEPRGPLASSGTAVAGWCALGALLLAAGIVLGAHRRRRVRR